MSKESAYSRQFIAGVEEYIKTSEERCKIIAFYDANFSRFPAAKARTDFKDLILDTINEIFEGEVYRQEILPKINTVRRSRLKKRTRWVADYISKLEDIKPESKKHPLQEQLSKYEGAPQELIEKEKGRTLEWKEQLDSYFFEFPGHKTVGSASLIAAIKTDILLMTWDYVLEKLDGDIPFFYRTMPEDYVDLPLFGSSSFKLLSDTRDMKIIRNERGNFVLSISVNEGTELKSLKVMDSTDISIMSYVINQYERNIFQKKSSKFEKSPNSFIDDVTWNDPDVVIVQAHKLASFVLGYNPNSRSVDDIGNRCYKMSDYIYGREGSEGQLDISDKVYLFSQARHIRGIDEKTGESVNVVLFRSSDVLRDIVVRKKLIRIAEDNFRKLELSISRVIYYALEKDRITRYQAKEEMTKRYEYIDFQRIVQFKSDSKEENLNLIEKALNDFVRNGVCLKSATRLSDGSFEVVYLDLTDDEKKDLKFNTTLRIEKK